jgi:hypothetical protein
MLSLIIGLGLIAAAIFMLRVAKPQPDGTPARFLAGDTAATLYALAITALIGLGLALATSGAYAVGTALGG